jgi:lysyl-tRNA synthetase class 2
LDWRPTASLEALARRASLLAAIRSFFTQRGVLEVETPALAARTVTDPAIDSLTVSVGTGKWYLQTSPEFHMKRLLAAGAPAIVRIGPVFRADEQGRLHNLEFTMIEWYRPGFDATALECEVAALVDLVLGEAPYEYVTYRDLIRAVFAVDPAHASMDELYDAARAAGHQVSRALATDRRALLDLLFEIAAKARRGRVFVTEFPADQAALATTHRSAEGIDVADRFELLIDSVEIANGYAELTDAAVLEARMQRDRERRRRDGRPVPEIDERLLDAMRAGLPAMSGVALGFDRLAMLALGADALSDVIAFPAPRA